MIDWLTDTFIASSALMALVLLVRDLMRRQFGAAVAYALWLIPAFRFLTPPLTWTVERAVPAAKPLAASIVRGTAQAPLTSAADLASVDWQSLAIGLWLAGAAAMLLYGLFVYRMQRREVLRGGVQIARLGSIRIVRSAAVRGPVAFGIYDRVIAVPIDFDDRYDPQERRLAFDHELAHHLSGDLVVNHIAFALLCLQWFNPIAWFSHAAFRFDQEAACDARVLDKESSSNRATYAHAIAKAASGQALLFAGALDRPSTLHRRLKSMLTRPTSTRRNAGKALIALAATVALPLTASWATRYVDIAQPASPVPATKAAAPMSIAALTPASLMAAPAVAAAPVAAPRENKDGSVTLPGGMKLDKGSSAFFANDNVLLNGKVKRLDQLTPAERSRLRAIIAESQRDLARERAELPGELADLRREADRARSGEMRKEMLADREDLRRDLAEVDSEVAQLRKNGEDPEKIKAEIRASLREAESIDIEKQIREALEAANPDKIQAELIAAEQQMSRLLSRLDELDRR